MHQERNPTTVNQLLAQIQDLQNKVNSLSGAREFYDPESGAALERPTFLIKLLRFRVPGPCRIHRIARCIMGNVFERPPVQEGLPSLWRTQGHAENCVANSVNVAAYANKFTRTDVGHFWDLIVRKWYGTHVNNPNGQWAERAGILSFVPTAL